MAQSLRDILDQAVYSDKLSGEAAYEVMQACITVYKNNLLASQKMPTKTVERKRDILYAILNDVLTERK